MRPNNKSLVVLVALLLCLAGACANAQVLTKAQLHDDPDGMPGEKILKQTIEISKDVKLDAVIEETNKGNGTLSIGNLKLRVVKEYDDGSLYADGMAHVEFVNIGGGVKDLVVIGIAEYTDEKTEAVHEREPFVFIYHYDVKAKEFKLAYKHASFDLEDGPHARD